MKFGILPALGMEPGIWRLWDIARGMAMQSWHGRSSLIMPRGRRPDNDLDDVNAAFSRIYHSNGLGQVSET